jgi:spore coat polysaccharide biosynthesis protein SpsF
MKTVAIVQARMTSTRLPGKILKEVLGKPLLWYELERLRKITSLDEIVVATTINASDDPVVDLCLALEVSTYRGSECDVLSRYYEAARYYKADVVARFTADCPLIDIKIAGSVLSYYSDNIRELDYCADDVPATVPRGMDIEVFPRAVLTEAHNESKLALEREHVTPFIYTRPERYRIWRVRGEAGWAKYRLTVDTAEDFELMETIIKELYPVNTDFGLRDIIKLLEEKPELAKINELVRQKLT